MRDVWLIFVREVSHRVRQPAWVVMGLAQPLLFMFFFGPILTKFVAHTPGFPPGTAWSIFAPSLMLQMVLVGSSTVGMALLAEHRSGVLERFRVTPMRPAALLLGKVMCVTVHVLLQSILIVALCHLVFHLTPPLAGLAASMVIIALLSIALASASYGLALRINSEYALPAVIDALLMPLLLLSGTFLPITAGLAPPWLYHLSQINPVAHVMDTTRAVFRGDFSLQSVWAGLFSVIVMAVTALSWAVRTFAQQGTGPRRSSSPRLRLVLGAAAATGLLVGAPVLLSAVSKPSTGNSPTAAIGPQAPETGDPPTPTPAPRRTRLHAAPSTAPTRRPPGDHPTHSRSSRWIVTGGGTDGRGTAVLTATKRFVAWTASPGAYLRVSGISGTLRARDSITIAITADVARACRADPPVERSKVSFAPSGSVTVSWKCSL